MEQYIPKSALVAEIERLVDKGKYHEEYDCAYRDGNNGALYALKNKFDTLEVKKVDLEKAIDDYIYTHDGRKRLALELDWKCCNKDIFEKMEKEVGIRAARLGEDIGFISPLGYKDLYKTEMEILQHHIYEITSVPKQLFINQDIICEQDY